MKKIIGVSLISAMLIMSCQKKEEQSVQTSQPQTQNMETQPAQQQQTEVAQTQKTETTQEKKETQPQPASTDGKSIFISKGCGACHQENADTVGPSLKKIASVYAGDKAKLTAFLKGEGKAIVDPAKEAIMKPQIEITKKLSSQELEALADFIIKH